MSFTWSLKARMHGIADNLLMVMGSPLFSFLECGVDDTSWIADTITSTLTI